MRNKKDQLLSLLLKQYQSLFEKWGCLLSVIIRIVSSKKKFNNNKYQKLCIELYTPILEKSYVCPPSGADFLGEGTVGKQGAILGKNENSF